MNLLTQDVLSLDSIPEGTVDPAGQAELDKMENRVAVRQLLTVLPEKEYQVIRLTFGAEPLSTRAVAETLGISQSDVSRTQRSALVRMRESLGIS